MFQESQYQKLIERLQEPRRFIQIINTSSQPLKSNLASIIVSNLKIPYLFASVDEVSIGKDIWLRQLWNKVQLNMAHEGLIEFIMIIDEIQNINQWSEIVKLFWDEDTREQRNIKLVLFGSHKILFGNYLTESLMGRFEIFKVNPHE